MRVRCPKCEKALKVDDKMAGKRGRCPGCGQVLVVPTAGGIGSSAAGSETKELPSESVSTQDVDSHDRSALLSSVEDLAKQHWERMDRVDNRLYLGCLCMLLFFPVGIALFVSYNVRKREAQAEASKQLRKIKRKYAINTNDLFSVALQCPTVSALDSHSLLPLIDEVAFQKRQEQRTQIELEELRRLEKLGAVAALPELFRQRVLHETPNVIGVAYWSSLGSMIGTGVWKLAFGGLAGNEHRVGLVAVTNTHLYVVGLGTVVGEDLTLKKLRGATGAQSVRKAALRNLKATSRAEVLHISGDLALKATFPRCYHKDNPGRALLIEQAITEGRK